MIRLDQMRKGMRGLEILSLSEIMNHFLHKKTLPAAGELPLVICLNLSSCPEAHFYNALY